MSGMLRVLGRSTASKGREMRLRLKGLAILAVTVALAGCASTGGSETAVNGINDPYEGLNRRTHSFNKTVDRFALRPVAQGYDAVTPGLFRLLISNGLNHLALPADFANQLLSAQWQPAGETLARFGINTVAGAGGLLDPATDFGVRRQPSDFGKTMAFYGVGEGPYFESPFLGPTTTRDFTGRVVDILFDPTTYISGGAGTAIGAAKTGGGIIEARADNAELIDSVLYESGDSYATTRSAYLQNRRAEINGGQADPNDAPDVFAE